MQPIARDEILGASEYERTRPERRRRIIALKRRRRVTVGEHATFHFESRETMVYQVHEMLRAEDSWERPGAVEDEFEAYNPLIPNGRELSATLMFEYETEEERAIWLSRLVGIDDHIWLHVGDTPPVKAVLDNAQVSPTRISSVQYVKWPLSGRQIDLVKTPGTVLRIVLDHPEFSAQAVLGEDTRAELASDLD